MKIPFLRNACTLVVLSLVSFDLTAQSDNEFLQTILTEIVSQSDEEQDPEQLFEQLEMLAENPVKINQASYEDLTRLFWLTEFQIKSLLDYITTKGAILSPYEIAYLYGFTPEIAQNLQAFISLAIEPAVKKLEPAKVFRYGKHKLVTGAQSRLEKQAGYTRPDSVGNRYQGSPVKTYLRYSFNYSNRVKFGVTAEKDAGEAFFGGNNRFGYDFYSAHFQLNTQKFLKTLVVGDYRADFGQGLALWSGMSYGKTAMLLNAMRYNGRLRSYTSTDENRFFRGAGATFAIRSLDASVFYSHKAVDATVSERDDDGRIITVSAFPNTGYHRTPYEIDQKDKITEQTAGANFSFNRTNWHIGATAVYHRFDATLVPTSYVYNHYAYSGKDGSTYSLDFRFRLGNAVFYGEQAIAQNGAMGGIYGSQMLIGERLTANVLYRNYARNFNSHYGKALGESAQNSNEEGFYFGWSLDLGGLWRLSSYWDVFRFPWMRYRTSAPSFGQDAFVQADYTPSRETKIYLQLRYKDKEENAAQEQVATVVPVKTMSAKGVFSQKMTDFLTIGNHLEIKNYRKEQTSSNGYFLAQDVRANAAVFRNPLQLTFRYALFDTDDYNSCIYAYENDMLYAFSIPSVYDRGTRWYLMLKYSIGKHFDIAVRYAATRYTDRNTISSGLNETKGNKSSEVKAQLICKF
ncbi:hypothetical protein FACS189464_2010 [Bacteroidia bacterium]|nr:hypothetical protein FACS189464_2010 [Bacteroidia bacterium]